MNKPKYTWDAEKKIATCELTDSNGRKFTATSQCHPDDFDFANEYTGYHIASERALIKYLKYVKKDILEPGLAALNQLYYSINKSKEYNPKSYESRMLKRQIRLKEEDLATIKSEITNHENNLAQFLRGKDLFYKKTRTARKNQQDESK